MPCLWTSPLAHRHPQCPTDLIPMPNPKGCESEPLKMAGKYMQIISWLSGLGESTQTWAISTALGNENRRLSVLSLALQDREEVNNLKKSLQEETISREQCVHRKSLRKPQNAWQDWWKVFLAWSQPVRLEEVTASNVKAAMQDFEKHEKSRKHNTTKGHNNFPVTNTPKNGVWNLPDKKFNIVVKES